MKNSNKMQKNYTNATKCLKNAIYEIVAGGYIIVVKKNNLQAVRMQERYLRRRSKNEKNFEMGC